MSRLVCAISIDTANVRLTGILMAWVCISCSSAASDRAPSSRPQGVAATNEPTPIVADVYLPPEQARGSRLCLDPDSKTLRDLIRRAPATADTQLERRALAHDVEELHQALKKQYAGYPELLQHRDFDVEGFFARWAEELRAGAGMIGFEEGVIRYLVTLKRAHFDRHLQPAGWGRQLAQHPDLGVAEYQARGERDDLSQCRFPDGVHGFVHTLRSSEVLGPDGARQRVVTATVRGHRDDHVTLRCGAETIELWRRHDPGQPAARGEEAQRPVYEWRSLGDVALITIRRLHGSPEEQALLERLAEDYDEHRKHRTIVFDFRDNGGGNDGYFFAWLERAKQGTVQLSPAVEIEGALHPCRDWNSAVFSQIRHDVVDTAEAREERDRLRAAWPTEVPGIRHRVFPGLLTLDAENPYEGRVIALVNRATASSGESAPAALRAAFGALLVGERTAGYLEYGNLQPVILPHTGHLFWVPIKRYYYDPPAEGVGLAVDYYLDTALMQEPAEALLPLLARLPGAAP